jgi:hypothetical protein
MHVDLFWRVGAHPHVLVLDARDELRWYFQDHESYAAGVRYQGPDDEPARVETFVKPEDVNVCHLRDAVDALIRCEIRHSRETPDE